jgi:hypothetical protein
MYISLTKCSETRYTMTYNKKYFAKPYLLLFTWQGIKGGVNNILSSNVQQHTHADKKGKAYSCLIILYTVRRWSNNFCTLYTLFYNTHAVFNINNQYFQIRSVGYKQSIKGVRMNKMDIQCPFEYLACVEMSFGFALCPFACRNLDLKGATTYKTYSRSRELWLC